MLTGVAGVRGVDGSGGAGLLGAGAGVSDGVLLDFFLDPMRDLGSGRYLKLPSWWGECVGWNIDYLAAEVELNPTEGVHREHRVDGTG